MPKAIKHTTSLVKIPCINACVYASMHTGLLLERHDDDDDDDDDV